jgi:hypothetical protein
MYYSCPVCGFGGLEFPPKDHAICPCCGTQFDYDDVTRSHEELRDSWIARGPRWFYGHAPYLWNPWRQLTEAGLAYAIPFTAEVHLSQSFVAYGSMSTGQNPGLFVHFQ